MCRPNGHPANRQTEKGINVKDISSIDYSEFDRPEILSFLFHPRKERGLTAYHMNTAHDSQIPVEDGFHIGARLHHHRKDAPTILFFHGNGEIVADYDDLGLLYSDIGINFFPVDYRGYGMSSGTPTVTGMMKDCHLIFDYLVTWLAENAYSGPVIVMGRSLGSASALELVGNYEDRIDALVIESGFAYAMPLLKLLGINPETYGLSEEKGFMNIEKIKNVKKPTLMIHAEFDHIIPFDDGQALFDASPASDKTFLKIPGANHNDIFAVGIEKYMKAVRELAEKLINR